MRISIDFEGVITQSWSAEELRDLDRETLLFSTLSIASDHRRFGARSIVSFLGAFASLEIITERPPHAAPAIIAWLQKHLPGLGNAVVHSCPREKRVAFIRSAGIDLHLAHGAEINEGDPEKWITWHDQPIEHLIRQLARILERQPCLRLAHRQVIGMVELPSFSSTPVYRVNTMDGPFKLRIVEHERQSVLLSAIHKLAGIDSEIAELLPSELTGFPAFVHAIPYRSGWTVETRLPEDGLSLVEKVARWQAVLHERTAQDDGTCLVSCACDAFNLCVADDGSAGIIDAADCLYAARWLDLIWTERLLCPWTGHEHRYFETYFDLSAERPTPEDVTQALAGYYYWHQSIVRHSLRRRVADSDAFAMLSKVKLLRAPTPLKTLLRTYTVG